jgi:hypothetical protein
MTGEKSMCGRRPLPHAKVKRIAAILADAWEKTPAEKAAAAMIAAGFNSVDLLQFGRTKTASRMHDHWRTNTINEMRDFEIRKAHNESKEQS